MLLAACSSDAKTTDTTRAGDTTVAAASETTSPGAETSLAADTTVAADTTQAAAATQAADTSAPVTAPEPTSAGAITKPIIKPTAKATARTTVAVGANAIPRLKGEVGALKDATVASCAKDGKNWVASGSVLNPTDGPATYVIAVSFLDTKAATLGLNWTRLDGVGAGATKNWKVSAAAAGDELQCILRVTRAKVGE